MLQERDASDVATDLKYHGVASSWTWSQSTCKSTYIMRNRGIKHYCLLLKVNTLHLQKRDDSNFVTDEEYVVPSSSICILETYVTRIMSPRKAHASFQGEHLQHTRTSRLAPVYLPKGKAQGPGPFVVG